MARFSCLVCHDIDQSAPVCDRCKRRHHADLYKMDWARTRYVHVDEYQRWWTDNVWHKAHLEGKVVPSHALVLERHGEDVVAADELSPLLLLEEPIEWVACLPQFFSLDAEIIIENALEDMHESAGDFVGSSTTLQPLLDDWVKQHAADCYTLYDEHTKEGWPQVVVTDEQIAFAIGYAMWRLFGGSPPTRDCVCETEAGDSPCEMHGVYDE